ncbi:MAG: hypothetical protein CMG06_07810, partial [Candidatus Marinimicrobia bacterium]|nr:hypothetical protein [Candidatus Neomarinimicrobiota bacterium]
TFWFGFAFSHVPSERETSTFPSGRVIFPKTCLADRKEIERIMQINMDRNFMQMAPDLIK